MDTPRPATWTIDGTDRAPRLPRGIDPTTGHITPRAAAALIVGVCGGTDTALTVAAGLPDRAIAAEVADLVDQVKADTARKAAAAGLPGITTGDAITYIDADGAARTGTYVRVDEYGVRRGGRVHVTERRVVVRTSTGEDVYAPDSALVEKAAAPALPTCTNTKYTPGNRCTECRVHRRNHAK